MLLTEWGNNRRAEDLKSALEQFGCLTKGQSRAGQAKGLFIAAERVFSATGIVPRDAAR